jgi:hypothetical protein
MSRRTNRKPGEPYTPEELRRSSLTKLVQTFPHGAAVYSHRVKGMAGSFVAILSNGWEAADTFQDAKRIAVYFGESGL